MTPLLFIALLNAWELFYAKLNEIRNNNLLVVNTWYTEVPIYKEYYD